MSCTVVAEPGGEGHGGSDGSVPTTSSGAGASAGSTGGSGGTLLPETVTVFVRSALIAPSKAGGAGWDPGCSVETGSLTQLAGILSQGDPYAAAASFIAELALPVTCKPDPFGFAGPVINGVPAADSVWLASQEANQQDLFDPVWPGAPATSNQLGWGGLPLGEDLRIEINLEDEDIDANDPIGVVQVSRDDVIAALDAGDIYQVLTSDQGTGGILFVGISVFAE